MNSLLLRQHGKTYVNSGQTKFHEEEREELDMKFHPSLRKQLIAIDKGKLCFL